MKSCEERRERARAMHRAPMRARKLRRRETRDRENIWCIAQDICVSPPIPKNIQNELQTRGKDFRRFTCQRWPMQARQCRRDAHEEYECRWQRQQQREKNEVLTRAADGGRGGEVVRIVEGRPVRAPERLQHGDVCPLCCHRSLPRPTGPLPFVFSVKYNCREIQCISIGRREGLINSLSNVLFAHFS